MDKGKLASSVGTLLLLALESCFHLPLLSTLALEVPSSCGTCRDSTGKFLAEEREPEVGTVQAGYIIMCDNDAHADILEGWDGVDRRS